MFKLEEPKYCSRCVLQEGWGTELAEDGRCPACRGGEASEGAVAWLNRLVQIVMDFRNYAEQNRNNDHYDCILMLSGGKDSVYMLHKLVNIDKFKPLAFTFINPFESSNAVHNIERTLERLNVEHIGFTPKIGAYKALLKHILSMSAEEISSISDTATEKIPCGACTAYMMLMSCLFAVNLGIPYILYCADPNQMATTPPDILKAADFLKKFCGKELIHMLFGNKLETLEKVDKLPEIVFPYIAENYDERRIISEVKELGLYETSPNETHCSLYGLLQYFSIKNFNRYFYAAETAARVRSGKMNREAVITGIDQFKVAIMQIAAEENISPQLEGQVKGILKYICSKDSEVEYMWNNIRNIRQVAKELDIKL